MLRLIAIASLLASPFLLADEREPTKKALANEFGEAFRIIDSNHWIIVTDAPNSSANGTSSLLEKTHDVFYREWSDFGAQPLSEPLVCIAFADAKGLDAYRKRLGSHAPEGTGFYSTLSNRIVLCDEDKEPAGMVRQRPKRKGETRKHSRAAHEATHQLAFNSGVQIKNRAYPAWFGEGLAGNYEPATPSDRFGLTAKRRSERFAVLGVLRKNDDLIPLADFVGMPHSTESREMAQVLYPQSAAFFRFLFNKHPQAFKNYQQRLASARIYSSRKSDLKDVFTKAFGPIEKLEPAWEQHLEDLTSTTSLASKRSKPRRRGGL